MNEQVIPREEIPAGRASGARADRMIGFLREYAETRVNSRLMDERRCITPGIVLDLARQGLLGLQVEERYSGQALTYHDAFRVMEQIAAIDPSVALFLAVHNSVGMTPVNEHAAAPVRREVLPLLASGRALCTIAASEPGAAGNFQAISTRAVKQRDGSYVLSGEKRWISLGAWAEYISVFAKLEDEQQRPQGITGFLVRTDARGFHAGEEALTYGMKGLPQNYLRLEDVRVPPEMLLGREGQGRAVAQSAFNAGRLYVSVMSLGAMKRCLQIADRYARGRPVATGRLFDNGVTQAILNHCVAATRSVEQILHDLAARLDDRQDVPEQLYLACKVMASELMWEVVDRCVQMLGARGFVDTNVVGQYFRDFRLIRIFEGPTELLLVYLGREAAKHGGAYLDRLTALYGASPAVQLLRGLLEELGGPEAADPDAQTRDRHVLYAGIGELTCRGTLAAVMSARARVTGDPGDAHAAAWCERMLRDSLRRLRETRSTRQEQMPPASIEATIAGYARSIGDTEQALPGEDRELDRLLRRP